MASRAALLICLLLCGANARAATPSVVLRWVAVEGAVLYDLEIATDAAFTDVVRAVRIPQNGYRWEARPARAHFFRARGIDKEERAGPWSEVKEIAAVFVAPPLITPTGGETIALDAGGAALTASFTPSPIFDRYRVEVASEPGFKTIVASEDGVSSPIRVGVTQAGTYWLRLIAGAGDERTEPSAARSVSVGGALGRPALLTPDSMAAAPGQSVKLEWRPVRGAGSYRVQLSTTTEFTQLIADGKTTRPVYELSVPREGLLYWRVIAQAPQQKSSISEVRRIDSQAAQALVAPPRTEPSALGAYFELGGGLRHTLAGYGTGDARFGGGARILLGPGALRFGLELTLLPLTASRPAVTTDFSALMLAFQLRASYQLAIAGPLTLRPSLGLVFGPAFSGGVTGVAVGGQLGLAIGYALGPLLPYFELAGAYVPLSIGAVQTQAGGIIASLGLSYDI